MSDDACSPKPMPLSDGLRLACFARLTNPGASHFLEGVSAELMLQGHRVRLAAPDDSPEPVCEDADLVIVHDGLTPGQVARIGRHRRRHGGYRLLFRHAALQGLEPGTFDLGGYDGVLAASRVIADICLSAGVTGRAWIWPDAADTRRFRPAATCPEGDVVFFGAWGDQSRGCELRQFLLEPIRLLSLRARAFGPPFPAAAVIGRPQIASVQQALLDQGFAEIGKADGISGKLTQAAITQYRQDKGLPEGGIDAELMEALGITA